MLTDKVALVTGASRGIGQAIALSLGRENAAVIGTATTDKGAQAITDAFQQAQIKGEGMALNVTDKSQLQQVLETITERYGSVDILVNNAGITRDNLLMLMKDEQWNDVIETNLSAVFSLSKAVLRPMMKKRYGKIISIASVVGVMGNAGQTNYAAAKAGMIGFSKSLAREVGVRGIRVNTVAPGFIRTDMTDALPQEQKDKLIENIALRELGSVEAIAAAVLFLASNSGDYITGETLHVNGGMYMS